MPLTAAEIEYLTYTLLGEARGEGAEGMYAVANVIRNRMESQAYPSTAYGVVTQYRQFTANEDGQADAARREVPEGSELHGIATAIVANVIEGTDPIDITGRALNYHATYMTPYWADAATTRWGTVDVGNHRFYARQAVPPMDIPTAVASALDVTPASVRPPARIAVFRELLATPDAPSAEISWPPIEVLQGMAATQELLIFDVDDSYRPYDADNRMSTGGLGSLLGDDRWTLSPGAFSPEPMTARQRIQEARQEQLAVTSRQRLVDSLNSGMASQEAISMAALMAAEPAPPPTGPLNRGRPSVAAAPPSGPIGRGRPMLRASAPTGPLNRGRPGVATAAPTGPQGRGRPVAASRETLPDGVSRITPEGLNVRSVSLVAIGPDGQPIMFDGAVTPTPANRLTVRGGTARVSAAASAASRPSGPVSSRGASSAALRRIAAAKRTVSEIELVDPMRSDIDVSNITTPRGPIGRGGRRGVRLSDARLFSPALPAPTGGSDQAPYGFDTGLPGRLSDEYTPPRTAPALPRIDPRTIPPAVVQPRLTRVDTIGSGATFNDLVKFNADRSYSTTVREKTAGTPYEDLGKDFDEHFKRSGSSSTSAPTPAPASQRPASPSAPPAVVTPPTPATRTVMTRTETILKEIMVRNPDWSQPVDIDPLALEKAEKAVTLGRYSSQQRLLLEAAALAKQQAAVPQFIPKTIEIVVPGQQIEVPIEGAPQPAAAARRPTVVQPSAATLLANSIRSGGRIDANEVQRTIRTSSDPDAARAEIGQAMGDQVRSSASPVRSVTGSDLRFAPTSVQNSSRWRTGY